MTDLSSQRARTRFIDHHVELVRSDVVAKLTALIPQLVKADRNRALARSQSSP